MEVDTPATCGICFRFETIIENFQNIIKYISMFSGKSRKDFGLYGSAVEGQLVEVKRLYGYHQDYHGRGDRGKDETLPNPVPVVDSSMPPAKPGFFKKPFRKGGWKRK